MRSRTESSAAADGRRAGAAAAVELIAQPSGRPYGLPPACAPRLPPARARLRWLPAPRVARAGEADTPARPRDGSATRAPARPCIAAGGRAGPGPTSNGIGHGTDTRTATPSAAGRYPES